MRTKHKPTSPMFRKTLIAAAVSSVLTMGVAPASFAAEDVVEEVVVTGIRGSLKRAIDVKQNASGIVDAIAAEDLGKFPDLNVAESLQRISGVSIDRSGGEGQQITVRGLGPQFNTVLLNGRQIATDSGGREFNFDVLAAEQITGANIYKSGNSTLQEGGIGATVNVTTAKPFDNDGLQLAGSIKGVYESLSEKTSPAASFLVSNTFGVDDRFGVLAAVSVQERDVQINRIETAGWRPGLTLSNNAGDTDVNTETIIAEDVYLPRNWDQIVDEQERKRTNASLVFQYAASDDLTVTLDGFLSKFEVDSQVTDLASWFEPDRVGSATIENGSAIVFDQVVGLSVSSGDPATDFVSHTRNRRDVTNRGFGLNFDWDISDRLNSSFDISTSSAENDRAGQDRFNVLGIINNYDYDGTGSIPIVTHDGFTNGSVPDANLIRLHYNERGNRPTDEDDITELKADFEFTPDSDAIESVRFGIYNQSREKSQFQEFANQCGDDDFPICGYNIPAPNDTLGVEIFTAENFFPGIIDTFYTYDGDAYLAYLESVGYGINPVLQNNRYSIDEDITSLYTDFTFGFDAGNVPVEINAGVRYAETDVDVAAVQSFITDVVPTNDLTVFSNRFSPETNFSDGGSYSDFLGNFNARFDIRDDMVVRFAAYESLTRPTMSQMSPATTFGEPRRQNLTARGGNPALNPFTSTNFDLSYEWYYSDDSAFSLAYFKKDIDDIIVTLTGDEVYELTDRTAADGFRCTGTTPSCAAPGDIDPDRPGFDVIANTEELNGQFETYSVTRPQNGESADIDGFEVAITHVWDNGFGITANATFVDSNVDLGTGDSFGFEGLGDSQNLVLFYENERFQTRLAYNNREEFLRLIDNGFNGEPVNTKEFGQWDISASYDLTDVYTVFFEGINITEEELVQTGRFANQIYNIEDNGSRYAIGVRGKW